MIGCVGLPRAFKEVSQNMFDTIVIPNSHEYAFDIFIHTDKECVNSYRQKKEYSRERNNVHLDKELRIAYNRFDQLKNITYFSINPRTRPTVPLLWRIEQLVEETRDIAYDVYIFVRMDVYINTPIDLRNYVDTFSIVSGSHVRPCAFHDRDYDFCWISNRKPLFLWLHLYSLFFSSVMKHDALLFPRHAGFQGEWEKYDECVKDGGLNQETIDSIYKETQLKGSYLPGLFQAVYALLLNGYRFELSETRGLWANLC